MSDLFERCGVGRETLTAGERGALDVRGFVVLTGLLDQAALAAARAAFERAVGPEPVVAGKQSGTRHAAATLLEEPALEFAFAHPRVLAAVHHVLARPFRLMGLGARDPLPGYGAQGLHTDWMPRGAADPFAVATAIWMLDEFTRANGATRVVPGSHRSPGTVPRPLAQPGAHHAGEEVACGPAGSVLVFNGHLWHAGCENASASTRRALQVAFVAAAAAPPGTGMPELPAHVASDLRALLGAQEEA